MSLRLPSSDAVGEWQGRMHMTPTDFAMVEVFCFRAYLCVGESKGVSDGGHAAEV